jgi:hypothetical protein
MRNILTVACLFGFVDSIYGAEMPIPQVPSTSTPLRRVLESTVTRVCVGGNCQTSVGSTTEMPIIAFNTQVGLVNVQLSGEFFAQRSTRLQSRGLVQGQPLRNVLRIVVRPFLRDQ